MDQIIDCDTYTTINYNIPHNYKHNYFIKEYDLI